jgi:uncharacterized protein YhbP (UPF0306 family)
VNHPALAPALDYLDRHHVMTLATCGARGPWAAAVLYVRDGTRLCFVSSPASRHGADLAADARAAATVQDDEPDWRVIRGVQLEGRVEVLAGAEEERVRALYGARFAVAAGGAGTPAPIAAALAKARWYALTPDALYLVDNAVAFGHRARVL